MSTQTLSKSNTRDDVLLIVGQTLSQISDRMVQLGLIWFITSTFGENFLIWYLVVGGLPHALLVAYSSRMIDRFGSLKTVLYSDLARGVIYLLSFLLILSGWFNSESGISIMWLLFISVFISNVFSAFFNPAIMSLSVEIKPDDQVQKLTAKLTSVTSLATIIGPVFGLLLFNKWGLHGLFLLASLSYVLSAYAVSLVTKSLTPLTPKMSPADQTPSSVEFSLFKTTPIIGVMLLIFLLMNLLLSPLQVLMPSMAKDVFGNSFNSLAILETVIGSGILLGGAILSFFSIQKMQLFWTWICLVLLSLSFSVFTYKASFVVAAIALFGLGLFLGLANVLIINILQITPKTQHVPKVMSLVNLISTATLPFSLALFGVLQQTTSIFLLGQFAGLILVLFSIFSFFPFRRYGQEIFK